MYHKKSMQQLERFIFHISQLDQVGKYSHLEILYYN